MVHTNTPQLFASRTAVRQEKPRWKLSLRKGTDGVRALDLTPSHESHTHYVRAGGPAITFCAVTCWCWLTMLTTTAEGSILFFQLVIRITVNSNVTSFPALNVDVWAKWNAPLILINVMNWTSIWTLLHSLGVSNRRPGQCMLKAVCCSGVVEMSICTARKATLLAGSHSLHLKIMSHVLCSEQNKQTDFSSNLISIIPRISRIFPLFSRIFLHCRLGLGSRNRL